MRLYADKKENNKSRAAANNLPSVKGVKQLMTIYPADTKKIDRIISADVKLQSDRAGGNMYESKDLKADKSLPLSDGEGIIVVGHGATGVVEGTDGEVIGAFIKNSVTEIRNAKYVYLSACETAKGGEGSAANKVAKGLGIDPSKVAGTKGYKVNNIDPSISEAVYHIEDASVAGGIQNMLAKAYGLDLFEHPPGVNSMAEAKKAGEEQLGPEAPFRKFLSDFGKAMSGNEGVINDLIVRADAIDALSKGEKLLLKEALLKAKTGAIGSTALTTGDNKQTTYGAFTKKD